MKSRKFSLSLPIYFILLILYLETAFHLFVFRSVPVDFLYILLFSLVFAFLAGSICRLFQEKVNYILTVSFTVLLCLFFSVQLIYHAVFQKFLALFSMLGVAGQAFDFMDVISKNVIGNILGLVLFLLPVPLLITGKKREIIKLSKKSGKTALIYLGIAAECYLCAFLFLSLGSQSAYGSYDIYFHNVSTDMTVKHFGVLTMTRLDGLYSITGKPEKTIQLSASSEAVEVTADSETVNSRNPESKHPDTDMDTDSNANLKTDTSPNTLNIDFDRITASAPNENVVQLTQYFQSQSGTNKNKYTGMFEGYNVIFITAEGFSQFVIDQERTPALYRLKQEGFKFNHYYTPGWYASTSDGEYANLTGLLPTDGIVSLKLSGERKNNMYFTLGRQLERLNYSLNGYHNNSYTYYGRDVSHPNMGYNWHGTGNWFQPETTDNGSEYWPQSDLQLIRQSMPEYMDKEPFHTYYMTVSGHMMYGPGSNQMSYQNYDMAAELPYSETTKGYIACQMELEKAVSALVNELERKGIADRTVIILSADHIPYDDKPVCDELAGRELESAIEWYENDLIIWSGSMEEPVTVDKYCYDVDILPTVSNLLGLPYDSRLMIGQDILSDSEQLVCFPDRSFISGKCIYNTSNGTVTPLTEEEVTQEYLDNLLAVIYNKFVVSELTLMENYYQYLDGNLQN